MLADTPLKRVTQSLELKGYVAESIESFADNATFLLCSNSELYSELCCEDVGFI